MHAPLSTFAIFSAALFHVISAGAADKVSLRPQWEPGKAYHLEVNTVSQVTTANNPQAHQEQNVTQQVKATVSKEEGSDYRLVEMSFESVKATVATGREVETYDSTDAALSRPHLQQAFGTVVSRTFTLVYDKEGKFLELRVPDPNGGSTPLGDFKGMTNKQFAEVWQKSLEFGWPELPLTVGDTYEQTSSAELPPFGATTTKTQGRFDSMVEMEGHKHAKLVIEGRIELAAGGPLQAPAEAGRTKGEIFFDLERHLMTSSSIRTEIKLPADFGGMTLTSTILTRLKSVDVNTSGSK